MKMEVEVVSREIIKPSSPTPNHLKTFNLSFFDQISTPKYVPQVLFYEHDKNQDNTINNGTNSRRRLDLIKKSLADTLTVCYPFAGQIQDNMFVDCNDGGVEYLEARVRNCRLSELMQHPNLKELSYQLLPWDPYPYVNINDEASPDSSRSAGPISMKSLLTIQVTIFEECGGIVISGYFSHKIADASSMFNFINEWAATARAAANTSTNDIAHLTIKEEQGPDFKLLPSLFPLKYELKNRFVSKVSGGHNIAKIKGQESIAIKKFVFGASKIAELKKRSISTSTTTTTATTTTTDATNNNNDVVHPTTRVQAVSAFVWKCFIDVDVAEKKKKKEQERAAPGPAPADDNIVSSRVYALTHVINIRRKLIPPLPTNSMGNLITNTRATVELRNNDEDDDEMKYPNLVRKVRESINKFDCCEYVRKLQTGDLPSDENPTKEVIDANKSGGTDEMVLLNIISWCGYKIYERSDFGWGKPKWIHGNPIPIKNFIRLMDTSSGDGGIEVWLSLSKQDMAEFERHPEIIAFTDQ